MISTKRKTLYPSVWFSFSDSAVTCAGWVDSRDDEADYSSECLSQQIPQTDTQPELRFPTDSELMADKTILWERRSPSPPDLRSEHFSTKCTDANSCSVKTQHIFIRLTYVGVKNIISDTLTQSFFAKWSERFIV